MSVQVKRRRESSAFLASFVGAQGELLVDTTNNRVQVHDGVTPGGWPAAKLADVVGRTVLADTAYAALASDRTIAVTALTASRVVTLPAASVFPTGTQLLIVDESGACSATLTIIVTRAGTDTINGVASATIALPYGFVALMSNGVGKWTLVDQSTASMAQQAASSVTITGGTIAGLTSLATSTTGALTAGYVAQIGGSVSPNRFFAMDTSGRATCTYSDNSVSVIQTLRNGAITAANQGASFADIYLGPTIAGIAISGRLAMLTNGTYASSATRNSFWMVAAESAGSLVTCMYFDPIAGNRSAVPLVPSTDNSVTLGAPSARWSQIYAGTSVINTSDAREKTAIAPLDEREIAASIALAREVGTFKFLAALERKGDKARTHVGLTVQRAVEIMTSHGLDPMTYAFICHDAWDAILDVPAAPARPEVAATYKDGELVDPGSPSSPEMPAVPGHSAGDRYGFRIDELLLFVARGFDARLSALEAR